MTRKFSLVVVVVALVVAVRAQSSQDFAPLEGWRKAVLAGDAAALDRMYAHDPRSHFIAPAGESHDPKMEVAFWSGFKRQGLTAVRLELVDKQDVAGSGGAMQLIVTVELRLAGGKSFFVNEAQLWGQEPTGAWMIAGARHDAPA